MCLYILLILTQSTLLTAQTKLQTVNNVIVGIYIAPRREIQFARYILEVISACLQQKVKMLNKVSVLAPYTLLCSMLFSEKLQLFICQRNIDVFTALS